MTSFHHQHLSRATTRSVRARGFTLIELMVGVAILAVLAAIAGPNMGQFLSARRVEDVARRLGEDLNLARNEAVKRNANVMVCATINPTSTACNTPTAAVATAAWGLNGWSVCIDANLDNVCDTSTTADPNPLRTQPTVNTAVSLTGPTTNLAFNAHGALVTAASPAVAVAAAYSASAVGRSTGRWTVNAAASGAITVRKGS